MMEPSARALEAEMEDGRRRLIAGSVYEALAAIEDMSTIISLAIDVHLEEPGQLSGNVAVQVRYQRQVTLN
jgi:hypothetical protein